MEHRASVLVVAQPAILDPIQRALREEHEAFAIRSANRAEDARKRWTEERFDCLVCQQRLSDGTGLEVIERAREDDPDIPAILVADDPSPQVAQRAVASRVTDYVPLTPEDGALALVVGRVGDLVEERRERRRARRLERVDRLIREVDRSLVRSTSRREIEQRVCGILAGADHYRFAWIGQLDETVDIVKPTAWAGIEESYLREIVISAREEPQGLGPTGRAVRSRRLQVMQDILTDPDYEPWREAAIERGYRSSAAVPLVHDDTLYGVLNLYADVPGAFDSDEQAMLEDVAGSIAFAMHTVQTRKALQEREQRLAEQQRYTEQVLQAFPDAVYVIDRDGNLRDWNGRVPEITGYTDRELRSARALDFFPGDVRDRLASVIERTFEEGSQRFQAPVVTKTGEQIDYEFASAASTDPEGEPVIVGVGRDVSERNEREARLERQTNQLEVLNRLVRHDIKNDMMVVTGLTGILRDQVPSEFREDLTRVHETGEHTLHLTEVARDLVEVIRGGGELEIEPTPLDDHLRNEVDNASRSFPEATFDVGEIPHVDVTANQLLGAVFRNVLNNAVQHNDKDNPRVQVTATLDNGALRVRIADNGPGIPAGQRETLFERSEQLTSEETSIGLYLVKRLVDLYGGDVHVEDNEPEGTVFEVELPRARGPATGGGSEMVDVAG